MAQQRSILSVKVRGLQEVGRQFNRLPEQVAKDVGKALHKEARDVLEEAAIEVPKDTKALLNSRFVTPPIRSREEVKVICGFGTDSVINPRTHQPTSSYAVAVHERLDVDHPVGKAKFLEDPMLRRASKFEANIAAALINKYK